VAFVRIVAMSLLAYLVGRCAWDWKKLAHSGHLGADLAGIIFEGLVATLVLFYLRHRSTPSSAP
jgi:hypothetical protein